MAKERTSKASEPAVNAHRRRRIEAVQRGVEKLALESHDTALLVGLAAAFHFGTSLAYFTGRSEDALVEELGSALQFMQGRGKGEIRARVCRSNGDTHLDVTMEDQPFILDTVQEVLRVLDVPVLGFLHPILQVDRDEQRKITVVRPRTAAGPHESFLHFQLGALKPQVARQLEEEVLGSLTDAKWAVEDFTEMKERVAEIARDLSKYPARDENEWDAMQEAARLLGWALQENFVLLGCRSYRFLDKGGEAHLQVVRGSGLGVLRDENKSAFSEPIALSQLKDGLRKKVTMRVFPLVGKGSRLSRVHRRSHMDTIEIKEIGSDGKVVGEHRITGLFTAKALQQLCSEIPVLRRKLGAVLERAQVLEGSHEYKQIVTLFNSIPKSELFATSEEKLGRAIDELVTLQRGTEVRVSCRTDIAEQGISVMVILPRERFNTQVRKRVQAVLTKRFETPPVDYRLAISDEPFARFHFYFPIFQRLSVQEIAELESLVATSIRRWEDDFRDALVDVFDVEKADELYARYQRAIPDDYRASVLAVQAARDTRIFERGRRSNSIEIALDNAPTDTDVSLLRILRPGDKYLLSELMPVLTNLGLLVIDESTYIIASPESSPSSSTTSGPSWHLHTFRVQTKSASEVPLDLHEVLSEAILAVLYGRFENDELGMLVLDVGISIRQVELLRTFFHYLRQLGAPHSRTSVAQALGSHPQLTSLFVEYFETKFDPAIVSTAEERAVGALRDCHGQISTELDRVTDIGEDRILRGPLNVIDATVRTNYFQSSGQLDRIALKIECSKMNGMPRPVPLFEIFVQSPEMEGVHLRSGRVARGGIRWSDRRDDFRTEILGLMRTQVTKNSIIVPVGSKGGFVLKTSPATREEVTAEVEKQYRRFISGLLDLTDTRKGSEVIPPEDTVRYDSDDPYLVVAADRGTARLSDLGNQLAKEYGFWLDDAFASGGMHGYDHKKYGITARGAWECVRHLFREMGVHVDRDRFTVVGIGDMSGDVFGNGMLLSREICLVAAFDHRHIFVDPNPDPKRTFEERERLFGLSRSSWKDFSPDCLSKGAGVFSRHAKKIDLSPEIRDVLGTDQESLSSEELVRAILCLDVDLLYNGGIGTYVKASHEHHGDACDERNDAVRIDASDLRCKIIGEGGNLGLTQAARVEFSRLGGRIHTDFIDNSGGVDLSDHEVNIKIALGELQRRGQLDFDARNAVLDEIATSVVELVLETNRSQAQILSLEEVNSDARISDHLALLAMLQAGKVIDTELDRFPGAGELAARREAGMGLVRPELATLMSFTKIALFETLVSSELVKSPAFDRHFQSYFPEKILTLCGAALKEHPLRAEITATVLTNEIVYRCGLTTIARLQCDLGSTVENLARAYYVGDRLLDGSDFFARVANDMRGGTLDPHATYALIEIYRDALADVVTWLVRSWPTDQSQAAMSVDEAMEFFGPSFDTSAEWLVQTAPDESRQRASDRQAEILALGVPEDLAQTVANFSVQREIPPVLFLASRLGKEPSDTAAVYATVRNTLRVEAILAALEDLPVTERDDVAAARALKEQLRTLAVELALRVLELSPTPQDQASVVSRFFSAHGSTFDDYLKLVDSILHEGDASLGSFVILGERLRRLDDAPGGD